MQFSPWGRRPGACCAEQLPGTPGSSQGRAEECEWEIPAWLLSPVRLWTQNCSLLMLFFLELSTVRMLKGKWYNLSMGTEPINFLADNLGSVWRGEEDARTQRHYSCQVLYTRHFVSFSNHASLSCVNGFIFHVAGNT